MNSFTPFIQKPFSFKTEKALLILLLLLMSFTHGHADETASEPTPVISYIHAGELLAVPGRKPRTRQTIIIHDGKIKEIRSGYIEAETESVSVIDLKDSFVLPGLMDMHVHLTFTKKPFRREDKEGDDAYAVAEGARNAKLTLEGGITTVRNVGSQGYSTLALRDAINKGLLPGPRILTSVHSIGIGANAKGDNPGACYSPDSCRRAVRHQIEMGADLIKVYATCSGSKPCGNQNAPPLFLPDELEAIVVTAATRELPVTAHAHGTAGINAALRAGVNSIEHGSFNDEESHELFKKHGAFLVSTLAVDDRIEEDFKTAEGDMITVMQGFMDNHPQRAYAAWKAGVRIAAGSDAGITPHGKNAREIERFVEAGIPAEEAIVAATINAAELAGLEEKLGTIEAGKIADIIATPDSPLDDISQIMNVHFVMKEGQVYKQE
jgi:imidazolonepropionase-like amidohydrolase